MIVGLFSNLLPVGGVQLAGRHSALVLESLASEQAWPCHLLSLNDAVGEREFSLGARRIAFQGFAGSKASFLWTALRLASKQPHVVFAGHPNLAVAATAMKILAPRLRSLIVAHGVEVWEPVMLFRKAALRRADIVLAPSRFTCAKLAAVQGIPERKIRRVPWGLDPDFRSYAEAQGRLPLPGGFPQGRILLTIGRWSTQERYKGVEHLIEAVATLGATLPDLHLVAVGEGDDRPRLEQSAQDKGISGRVHFYEGLTRQQVAACYAHADVFALPSRGEGFGLVFLEAMAFGKPVIGANHGGTLDIIEDGKTGFLVEYGAVEKLSEAIRLLFSDGLLRVELGQRGKELVHRCFSFEAFEQRLRAALHEVVEE